GPSSIALIARVKWRAVAWVLMIEKVRSIAIGLFFKEENAGEPIAAAYSDRAVARQGVTTALAIQRGLAAHAKRQTRPTLNRPPRANLSAPLPFARRFGARCFIEPPSNPHDGRPD